MAIPPKTQPPPMSPPKPTSAMPSNPPQSPPKVHHIPSKSVPNNSPFSSNLPSGTQLQDHILTKARSAEIKSSRPANLILNVYPY
jgi:hypothetical protein